MEVFRLNFHDSLIHTNGPTACLFYNKSDWIALIEQSHQVVPNAFVDINFEGDFLGIDAKDCAAK